MNLIWRLLGLRQFVVFVKEANVEARCIAFMDFSANTMDFTWLGPQSVGYPLIKSDRVYREL